MSYRLAIFAVILLCADLAAAHAQARTIVGQVTDQRTGRPVGVGLVRVLGLRISDRLRPDGVFVLYAPERKVTILVSGIGYRGKKIQVPAYQEVVKVALEPDLLQLERLIIRGRAPDVERRHVATAVSSVNADEISDVPGANLEQALHGKVAGLQIQQHSSAPGGSSRIRIRGITSIFGSGQPLYVMDGVIVSNAMIEGGMNAISLAGGRNRISSVDHAAPMNRIADLNVNDIESIEILRGSAATFMYGSRGANGVIIITTKRGRRGRIP